MSTEQVRNVNYLIVGQDLADQTPANDEPISGLTEGEVGVFSLAGLRRDASDTDTQFRIVIGGASSKPFFVSDIITKANVKAISTKAGAAATEQEDSIGFNGTTGSIDDVVSTLYMVAIYVQEYLTSNTDGRKIKHFQYNSAASTNEAAIATGLTKSAVNNFSKEAEEYVGFKCLANHAGVVWTGTHTHLTFTKGSKTVLSTDAAGVANAGTITTMAAGDYIKVGVGLTEHAYKVASISGTGTASLVLEYPFQEATTTIAKASGRYITAAAIAGVACGVYMTGKPLSNVIGKEFYKKARWELSLTNFGTTTQVREANADPGSGTYEEISQQEFFMEGFKGEYHRMGEPGIYPLASKAESADAPYDLTTIQWEDSHVVGFTGNVSPKQLTIASPATGTGDMVVGSYMANGTEGVWPVLAQLTGLTVTTV